MNANAVIRIGLNRNPRPPRSRLLHPALALAMDVTSKLDDQDRVLTRECYQQHHPDLSVYVVIHATDRQRGCGPSQGERHRENYRK